jgi:hypothetical protein
VRKIVQIQTSTKCTAKCKICPHSTSMLAKQNAVMTDEVFKMIFRRLAEAKIEIPKLPLYMQNEPLTDPDYLDRLDFALNQVGTGYVEVSTNTSLLTREISRKLVGLSKGRRLTMVLSFQGTSKSEFEEMTGLSYDKCLKHTRGFLEEAQAGGPNIVIHSYGKEKEIMDFWSTKCTIWKLVRYPKIKVISYTNRAGNLTGQYAYEVDKSHVKKCIRHHGWLHFNWKGDVIICCNDYENEVVFGNVMKEGLLSIIHKIVPVIQRLSKDNPNFICRRCDARCIGQ